MAQRHHASWARFRHDVPMHCCTSELQYFSTALFVQRPQALWKTRYTRCNSEAVTLRKNSPRRRNALPRQRVAVLVHSFVRAASTEAVENIALSLRSTGQNLSTASQVPVRKRPKRACPQAYAGTIHSRCGQLHLAHGRAGQNIITMVQVPVAHGPIRACPQAYPGHVHNSCGELSRTNKNSALRALSCWMT